MDNRLLKLGSEEMVIKAKIANEDGTIVTVELDDDPTDADISRALGGDGNELRTEIASIFDWEVHALPQKRDRLLVIGGAPELGAFQKKRRTCDLPDDKVQQLQKHIRSILQICS